MEMATKQLLKRMISAEGMINMTKWQNISNLFTGQDYEQAMKAIGELTDWKLEINDAKHTITEIRGEIRKYVHNHPGQKTLIIIDYLQLIRPTLIRRDRRDLEVGETTRELKHHAHDLKKTSVDIAKLSHRVNS